MESTSASLLQRLKRPGATSAWDRFVDLYSPLLYHWAIRLGLQEADAADLVQEVFVILVRKLPEFEYDRSQSFRAWLKTVVLNQWRQRARARVPAAEGALDDVAAPEALDAMEEEEYRRFLIQRALRLIEPEFSPTFWMAFHQYALMGRPPQVVARELKIATGTVYSIKAKVLHRLRQELIELID